MPENNKTEEFLKKLAPCIERGELEACVEEAARVAGEMGIGAEELLILSRQMIKSEKHDFAYMLALVAAQGLEGEDKARAYTNAGREARIIGKLKESEEHYKKAIETYPKLKEAYYNYAHLLEPDRKIEAEEQYKEAIKADSKIPVFAWAHNDYANLLKELGRKIEAEEHYKEAIKANPKFAASHTNYATLLKELGRKIEAEEHYKQAIELDPENAIMRNNYADFLREQGQLIPAEEQVRKALEIEPANPYALLTLGDILADEGLDFKGAKEIYQEALKNSASIKEASTVAEIHNNLGWVYEQLKQYREAKEEFKKAIRLDPLNAKAHYNYRAIGKVEEGIMPKISKIQKFLAAVVLLYIIILFISFFIINKPSDTVLATQSTILIALLIFILLFNKIEKFKVGTIGFEKSADQRSQLIEAKR